MALLFNPFFHIFYNDIIIIVFSFELKSSSSTPEQDQIVLWDEAHTIDESEKLDSKNALDARDMASDTAQVFQHCHSPKRHAVKVRKEGSRHS